MHALLSHGTVLTCLSLAGAVGVAEAAPRSVGNSFDVASAAPSRASSPALLHLAGPRSEPRSTIPSLATPGPVTGTQAFTISQQGQVAGLIWSFGQDRPFLWERGVLTDLDPLGEWAWRGWGFAVDVNVRGQVVASAASLDASDLVRPLLLDHGRIIDLMESRTGAGAAAAINNRGQVVGIFADYGDLTNRAFLWDRGQWTDLGPCGADPEGYFPTFAYGLAINDRGDVVGLEPALPLEATSSFLWSNGVRTQLDFAVTGINQRGQIIGNSNAHFIGSVPPSPRAYLWEDGTRIDLGTLGGDWSFASAINDKGQIAGMSQNAAGESRVFLWEDGQMTDLGGGDPGSPSFVVVEGINSRGQVVGYDRNYSGSRGWLWDHGSELAVTPLLPLVGFGPTTMINDHGLIAFNVVNIEPNAFLWSDDEITPLTPPATSLAESTHEGQDPSAITAAQRGSISGPPETVNLATASANPFSRSIALQYSLPRAERVAIEVFDVRGVRVRSLVDEWQPAGSRLITWDGADAGGRAVPPGLYFSRLRVGSETRTVRLIRAH